MADSREFVFLKDLKPRLGVSTQVMTTIAVGLRIPVPWIYCRAGFPRPRVGHTIEVANIPALEAAVREWKSRLDFQCDVKQRIKPNVRRKIVPVPAA